MRRNSALTSTVTAVAVLAVAAGLTAGCGSGRHHRRPHRAAHSATPPPEDATGTVITSPAPGTVPSPGTVPGRDAAPTDRVIYNLQTRLLRQAQAAGPVSGSCSAPINGTVPQQVTCTIVYQGLSVPFDVTVKPGQGVFTYAVKQLKGVLVAETVRGAWYRQSTSVPEARADTVRCAAGLPPRELVDLDQSTRYTCSYRLRGGGVVVRGVRLTTRGVEFVPTPGHPS